MKNSINLAIIIAALFSFTIANTTYCSKPEDKLKDKESVKSENKVKEESQKETKRVSAPKDVKYIWKDMPTYDRYGNEITPRARENMLQNSLLNKKQDSQQDTQKEGK